MQFDTQAEWVSLRENYFCQSKREIGGGIESERKRVRRGREGYEEKMRGGKDILMSCKIIY